MFLSHSKKNINPGDPQGFKLYLQATKEIYKEYDKLYISVSNPKDIIAHLFSISNKYVRGRLEFMVYSFAGANNTGWLLRSLFFMVVIFLFVFFMLLINFLVMSCLPKIYNPFSNLWYNVMYFLIMKFFPVKYFCCEWTYLVPGIFCIPLVFGNVVQSTLTFHFLMWSQISLYQI